MIKIKHTKHYERKIRSNKVEYSAAAGVYCMTHDVKMLFCMPDFSSSKIINHHFLVNNDKGETGVGCDMIIGHNLMLQLSLTADFKRQAFQWDGTTVHMKEPSNFLGKYFQLSARCVRWLCRLNNQLPHERLLNEWLKSLTVPMRRQTLNR